MFNILKYNHDLVTDIVEIKVVFQLKPTSPITEDGGTFTKQRDGDAWLRKIKHDYLNIKIENFLYHKKNIIEAGIGHKSLSAKKTALDELYRYLDYSCKKASLIDACKWCIYMRSNFEAVLPSQSNPSYQTSVVALDEIMNFAKTHAKGAIYKQAS